MERKYHSSIYNVIMGMILKVSQIIFPLLTAPYVSRILLPEGTGRVSFAQSIVNIFILLEMLGIPLYGIKACAKVRDNKEQLSRTVKELLIINIVSLLFSVLLLIICTLTIPKLRTENSLIIVFSSLFILKLLGVEWFFQAIEQYDYLTVIHLADKIVAFLLLFIFVKTKNDLEIYATTLVISSFGFDFLNFFKMTKYVDLSVKNLAIKKHLKYILTLFAFSACTTIYTSMDTIMLGFMSSQTEVGFYNLAVKIKNLLVSLITVAGSVLLPKATVVLQKQDMRQFQTMVIKTALFNTLISLSISTFFILNSTIIINILGGSTFLPSAMTLKIIMPAIVFIGLSHVLGIQYLIPQNKEKYVLYSTLGGAASNIILNGILIPKFGSFGAAFATSVSEMIVTLIQLILIRNDHLLLISRTELLKIIVSLIVSIAISTLVPYEDNMFIKLIINALLFFISYCMCLLLMKEELMTQLLGIIKRSETSP